VYFWLLATFAATCKGDGAGENSHGLDTDKPSPFCCLFSLSLSRLYLPCNWNLPCHPAFLGCSTVSVFTVKVFPKLFCVAVIRSPRGILIFWLRILPILAAWDRHLSQVLPQVVLHRSSFELAVAMFSGSELWF